ncbi:hypothetical protein [Streptomyces sp. NPDC056682]|uniref:hypothetical protein n=1 Tax=Streptomyces sp. NPDC056682 TaxID=3345909 RepID=UPI0036B77CAE
MATRQGQKSLLELLVAWWYKLRVRQLVEPPVGRLDPAQVATTIYTVTATPMTVGWSLKVATVGQTTCAHMGDIERAARELVVHRLGMPPERVHIHVIRQ